MTAMDDDSNPGKENVSSTTGGSRAPRGKNGLYIFLTGVTVIFIFFYSTPTNYKFRTILRQKNPAMKSLWTHTASFIRTVSVQLVTEPQRNEASTIKQSPELRQTNSDSVVRNIFAETTEIGGSIHSEKFEFPTSSIDETNIRRATTTGAQPSVVSSETAPAEVTDYVNAIWGISDASLPTSSFFTSKKASSAHTSLVEASSNAISIKPREYTKTVPPSSSPKIHIGIGSSHINSMSTKNPEMTVTNVISSRRTYTLNAATVALFNTKTPTQENFSAPSTSVVRSEEVSTDEASTSSDHTKPEIVFPDASLNSRTSVSSVAISPDINISVLKTTTLSSKNKAISAEDSGRYLVDSKNCRIPDYDPFHPSVRGFIEYKTPLNCSDYPPLTTSDGNQLLVNYTIAHSRGYENFTCCYRALYRDKDGETDNKFRLNETCNEMGEISYISDEFLKVECKTDKGKNFYQNYHSFIQEKPEVEERCKNSSAKYSILLLGVDSMSRLNMHRQLNKTITYLYENLDPIEMYGFNKVGDNTFPNLIPLTTGYNQNELPKVCWKSNSDPLDKCDFIWKAFAKKGYRTFYAEDTPYISSFNYIKKGFLNQPTDYYFRPFILAYEDALGRRKPLNCYLCVGSISETEAVLHWTKEFAQRFSNKPYFSFSWINSLTHDFLNYGSSGDHMYVNFFKALHSSGALNNTIVILIGDHGMRWGAIRSTYIGRLEERLPMLVFLLPPSFRENHPEEARNLMQNGRRLVTPFDLHATLDHIMHIDEGWESVDTSSVPPEFKAVFRERAQSLLDPVSEDRSCDDAHIREHWCTCGAFLPADPDSNEVRGIAAYIVYQLNAILKPKNDVCARLKLSTVKLARVLPPPGHHKGEHQSKNVYTVILQTSPGDGLFEGTVHLNEDDDFELLGAVSRLNLYKNQSACVDDAILKKYCYCK